MGQVIKTSHNPSGTQVQAGDWIAAWTIKPDGSEKTSADDPGIFMLTKDFEGEIGAPLEDDFDSRGDNYPHEGNQKNSLVLNAMDVSLEALQLIQTLKGAYVTVISQSNRDPIDGKYIFDIYPRCRVENARKLKRPGNNWQLRLVPLPVAGDYAGIPTGKSTLLNALTPPPGADLTDGDGDVSSGEAWSVFSVDA